VNALLRTQDTSSLMVVRLALGIVMLPHSFDWAIAESNR
jgi:hypothetical protein